MLAKLTKIPEYGSATACYVVRRCNHNFTVGYVILVPEELKEHFLYLERRLYEIARKHCGQNSSWSIGIEKLKQKTVSTSSLPKFRYFPKEIERNDHLPDYRLWLNADLIHFEPRTSFVEIDDLPRINRTTIEKGRRIVEDAGTGWCFDELHRQFSAQLLKGFQPEKVDGAFINFIKKKVATQP